MPQALSGLQSVVLLDTSFNLYADGLALLKGRAMLVPIVGDKPGKPASRPIASFWIKAQGQEPTSPLGGKVFPAETAGYLLYGVQIGAVSTMFEAVWAKSPITVGARIKGEGVDRIYVGNPQISDADDRQGHECMEQLTSQMRRSMEAETAAPRR